MFPGMNVRSGYQVVTGIARNNFGNCNETGDFPVR